MTLNKNGDKAKQPWTISDCKHMEKWQGSPEACDTIGLTVEACVRCGTVTRVWTYNHKIGKSEEWFK